VTNQEKLKSVRVGDLVKVNKWKKSMRVKAVSENYIIMSQKAFGTSLYSIIDKNNLECGPDNYYGKHNYNNIWECEIALTELENNDLQVSGRRNLDIKNIVVTPGKIKINHDEVLEKLEEILDGVKKDIVYWEKDEKNPDFKERLTSLYEDEKNIIETTIKNYMKKINN
jgi:hypothetical protein